MYNKFIYYNININIHEIPVKILNETKPSIINTIKNHFFLTIIAIIIKTISAAWAHIGTIVIFAEKKY